MLVVLFTGLLVARIQSTELPRPKITSPEIGTLQCHSDEPNISKYVFLQNGEVLEHPDNVSALHEIAKSGEEACGEYQCQVRVGKLLSAPSNNHTFEICGEDPVLILIGWTTGVAIIFILSGWGIFEIWQNGFDCDSRCLCESCGKLRSEPGDSQRKVSDYLGLPQVEERRKSGLMRSFITSMGKSAKKPMVISLVNVLDSPPKTKSTVSGRTPQQSESSKGPSKVQERRSGEGYFGSLSFLQGWFLQDAKSARQASDKTKSTNSSKRRRLSDCVDKPELIGALLSGVPEIPIKKKSKDSHRESKAKKIDCCCFCCGRGGTENVESSLTTDSSDFDRSCASHLAFPTLRNVPANKRSYDYSGSLMTQVTDSDRSSKQMMKQLQDPALIMPPGLYEALEGCTVPLVIQEAELEKRKRSIYNDPTLKRQSGSDWGSYGKGKKSFLDVGATSVKKHSGSTLGEQKRKGSKKWSTFTVPSVVGKRFGSASEKGDIDTKTVWPEERKTTLTMPSDPNSSTMTQADKSTETKTDIETGASTWQMTGTGASYGRNMASADTTTSRKSIKHVCLTCHCCSSADPESVDEKTNSTFFNLKCNCQKLLTINVNKEKPKQPTEKCACCEFKCCSRKKGINFCVCYWCAKKKVKESKHGKSELKRSTSLGELGTFSDFTLPVKPNPGVSADSRNSADTSISLPRSLSLMANPIEFNSG